MPEKTADDFIREQIGDPDVFAPGEEVRGAGTPEEPRPEAHPEMGNERYVVMNLATTPETAVRYLENQGWNAKHVGGWQFAVKRPGEEDWFSLDPKGFDVGDILDIGGDIATGLGAGVGATLGAAGGLGGAMLGGAAGGAGVEALKGIVGQIAGLEPTTTEKLKGIGGEALIGAAAPIAGKALGALGRKIIPQTAQQVLGMSDDALIAAAKAGKVPIPARATPASIKASLAGVAPEEGADVLTARLAQLLKAGGPAAGEAAEQVGRTADDVLAARLAGLRGGVAGAPAAETFARGPISGAEIAANLKPLEKAGFGGIYPYQRIQPRILAGKPIRPQQLRRVAPLTARFVGAEEPKAASAAALRRFLAEKGRVIPGVGRQAGRARAMGTEMMGGPLLGAPAREAVVPGVARQAQRLGQVAGEAIEAGRVGLPPGAGIGEALEQAPLPYTEAAREYIQGELLGAQPISMLQGFFERVGRRPILGAAGSARGAGGMWTGGPSKAGFWATVGGTAARGGAKGVGITGRILMRNLGPLERLRRASGTPGPLKRLAELAIRQWQTGDKGAYKATLYTMLSRPVFRKALEAQMEEE